MTCAARAGTVLAACLALACAGSPARADLAAPGDGDDTRPRVMSMPGALPRVMSMNVCTDQLVLLLAEPGQIVALSDLSRDPALSYLHEAASAYPTNGGRAEEAFLAAPDLVVTGEFGLSGTAPLIAARGIPVEPFAYDVAIDDVPAEIRRMGVLLGQDARGEQEASAFEAELAALRDRQCPARPRAVAYEQDGVVAGAGTLASGAIEAAGLVNLAAELGYVAMTPMPLEALVAARPDIVTLPAPIDGAPALADLSLAHPALRALPDARVGAFVPRGAWSCAAPAVLDAVRALVELRETVAPCPAPE